MTRTQTSQLKKRLATGSFLVLALLCASYVYFIFTSVVHVVLQKEAEQAISKENARLGALESKLLSARESITTQVVLAQGFVPVRATAYATRASLSSALALRSGF